MKLARAALALVLLGGVGAGAYAFARHRAAADADPNRDLPVYTVAREHFVRAATAEGNLRAVKATPLTVPQPQAGGGERMKVAWLAPDGTQVKAGDVVVRFDPSDPEKQLRDGESDLASATARLGSEQIAGRVAVATRDTAAELADKELAQTRAFQSKDTQIYSRNQIVESAIDETLATQRKDNAEQTKAVERNLSRSKLDVIAVDTRKAQTAIKNAKAALAAMEIRAPHAGLFVLERDRRGEAPRVGDSMWSGQTVAEIPLLDELEAEVYVLEVDASGVNKDERATVTIDAHPETPFEGTVRLVEKLAKPLYYKVPVQYFQVVVKLGKTDLAVMKPGQRVSAKIVIDQTDALVVPRQAIANVDGKIYAYRRAPATGAFEKVEVELGAATSGRVVVTKGLAAGDVIAMRDPTRSAADALGGGSAAAAKPGGGGGPGGDDE